MFSVAQPKKVRSVIRRLGRTWKPVSFELIPIFWLTLKLISQLLNVVIQKPNHLQWCVNIWVIWSVGIGHFTCSRIAAILETTCLFCVFSSCLLELWFSAKPVVLLIDYRWWPHWEVGSTSLHSRLLVHRTMDQKLLSRLKPFVIIVICSLPEWNSLANVGHWQLVLTRDSRWYWEVGNPVCAGDPTSGSFRRCEG